MSELRVARPADIPRLVEIRAAVRENRLQDLAVGPEDYRLYVDDGRCWVWDDGGVTHGFAALDAQSASVWALFVDPAAEGRGIGRALLERVVTEARCRGLARLTLETGHGTRAERLYRAAGWQVVERDAGGALHLALPLNAASKP